VDRWQAFATPTRRPGAREWYNRDFGRPEADQENDGRMTDLERGARRGMREEGWVAPLGENEWGTPSP